MNIYILKNFTLKEVFFGVSDADAPTAALQHKNNPYSPVGHWKWGTEKIKWGLVGGELADIYAQAFLQALRREPPEEGWIVVVGGDS